MEALKEAKEAEVAAYALKLVLCERNGSERRWWNWAGWLLRWRR